MTDTPREAEMQRVWERSFQDQVERAAYNTAPVEALVRTVSHHLRARYAPADFRALRFLEVGCGAGPNLVWLAERGIEANGIDIAPTALELARRQIAARGLQDRLGLLAHGSATSLPFPDGSLDGVLESCVFQHLNAAERRQAFAEAVRVLKPGGVFVGYMLSNRHSTYVRQRDGEFPDDPGTIALGSETIGNAINLETIGLSHFFRREEFPALLAGCSVVDPCEATYELPREEARRRGYDHYLQGMWIVYAVK